MVNQTGDGDAGQGVEASVADKSRPPDFRLMAFAVAVAQLVVLAPTWLTVSDGGDLDVYSGIGWVVSEVGSPVVALRVLLLIAYVGLVITGMVSSPTTGLAQVRAPLGLGITGLMLILKPDSSESDAHWTGAPIIALVLWMVAIVVAESAFSTANRARPD